MTGGGRKKSEKCIFSDTRGAQEASRRAIARRVVFQRPGDAVVLSEIHGVISGTGARTEHRADVAWTSKDPLHHMWKNTKALTPGIEFFGIENPCKSDVLGRGLGWEADQDHVRRWPKDAISLAFFPFLPPAHRATESLTLCCRVCRGNKIAAQKNSEKVVLSNEGLQELPPTIAQLRACKVSHRCGETERETSPGGGTAPLTGCLGSRALFFSKKLFFALFFLHFILLTSTSIWMCRTTRFRRFQPRLARY